VVDHAARATGRLFQWTRPQGGIFVWATLPQGCDALDFFREAARDDVTFVPGQSFHPRGDVRNTLRLNFSNASPEKLEEAVERLGQAYRRCWGAKYVNGQRGSP
jgi:2-aminoadipate transaminase